MASLQKTYSGDLSTSIAGVIWDRIKQADDKRQLEKSKASEEVKQAALELKKDDDKSIPVKDKDLRDTVIRIFGPLEGKLLQTEGKIENLSAKITTVAGGIADTQKLLINRTQILEDKFDQMLNVIGDKSAIVRAAEAEAKFEDLEKQLEKGMDLSSTFAYEKLSTGSYGILGKLLSGILGNRFTAQLVGQISRALIPKGIRSRARLLRKSLLPVRKFARGLRRPGAFISKRVVTPFAIHSARQISKLATRTGQDLADSILTRRGGRFLRGTVFRPLGRLISGVTGWNATDKIARNLIKWQKYKKGLIKPGKNLLGVAAKKTPNRLKKTLTDGVFWLAMKSPRVRKALLKKVGREGLEKIGIKIAAGGTKGGFPVFGTGYAVVEGIVRLLMGDPKGMALSFGSGIPAAGWGFAIIDILRDIDREAYTAHIEPNLPTPSDQNISEFFQAALGLSPDQYERGNVNIKPGGMGTSISSISEILGVTKAFGDAAGFGGEVQAQIDAAGLGSYPIPKVGYSFDVGGRGSLSGVIEKGKEEEKELRKVKKIEDQVNNDDDNDQEEQNEDENNNDEDKTNFFGADQTREGFKNQGWDFWDWMPDDWFNKKGGGGIGGNDNVQATTPVMGGDGATIEFWGQQGRDLSGEPGVDFSYKDYKSNYNLFPGYVLETGLLYGNRYGNVVVVRSVDPSTGKEFDSLYSHFPDGGMAVKPGQQVGAGQYLGKVGFVSVDTPGVPQMQPNNAGNMSGWHTSVDFFEPGSSARYHNADKIINLVTGASGQTPNGLLEKLKPLTTTNDNQSSLNNIEANSKVSSTMTNMVENGSSERLMTKRKSSKRPPIVIINNQVVNTTQSHVAMGNTKESGNFFEAYNLARYTV